MFPSLSLTDRVNVRFSNVVSSCENFSGLRTAPYRNDLLFSQSSRWRLLTEQKRSVSALVFRIFFCSSDSEMQKVNAGRSSAQVSDLSLSTRGRVLPHEDENSTMNFDIFPVEANLRVFRGIVAGAVDDTVICRILCEFLNRTLKERENFPVTGTENGVYSTVPAKSAGVLGAQISHRKIRTLFNAALPSRVQPCGTSRGSVVRVAHASGSAKSCAEFVRANFLTHNLTPVLCV